MHTAEDILSETMLGFFSAVDGMGEGSNITAWLRSVAHNKVRDHYRKEGRRERLLLGVAEAHDDAHIDVDRLAGEETRDSIVRVLDQLTDDERLALEWKYIDGETVKTIAKRLGLTAKAAESLLYRGRRAFRKWFNEQDGLREQSDHVINDSSNRTLKP